MARNYSVDGNATNTASATLPLVNLVSAATVRPKIGDVLMGSDAAPADNSAKYAIQRGTTAGTPGSAITPQAIDPADPAALASSGLAVFSVGPTLTAAAFLLQWAQNQRATFRWFAIPGKELVLPATANYSLNLMSLVVGGSAVNMVFAIQYEE